MTTAETHGCPVSLHPLDPAYDADIHGSLRRASEASWYAITPSGPMALHYDQVAALLRDPRMHELGMDAMRAIGITDGPLWEWWSGLMFSVEGADHARLRRLIARPLGKRAAENLRPAIRSIADRLVDQLLEQGDVEFVDGFAGPFTLRVMGAALGIGDEHDPVIHEWARSLSLAFTGLASQHREEIEASIVAFRSFAAELIAARHLHPSDDLLSDLVRSRDDGDRLDDSELECLVVHLIFGGYNTTQFQLACAVVTFLDHRDQWNLLAAQPHLATRAIEEVVRYEPGSAGASRVASVDVEILGLRLPAGTVVHPATIAANRDPRAFADPDHFDITATRGLPSLTWGGGAHFCPGMPLAVTALEEAIAALATRTRITATGPVQWQPFAAIRGPIALQLHLSPR